MTTGGAYFVNLDSETSVLCALQPTPTTSLSFLCGTNAQTLILSWFKHAEKSRKQTVKKTEVWMIPFQFVEVYGNYPEDSPWPLLSHDRFPVMSNSRGRAVCAVPFQRWGMNAACCEARKTAVEQANALAPINHTSVVSWMHTNLYVLDLCGRSNLTKIHTGLSSWSRAVINENYLHKRKWAGEKEKGRQGWRRQRNDK